MLSKQWINLINFRKLCRFPRQAHGPAHTHRFHSSRTIEIPLLISPTIMSHPSATASRSRFNKMLTISIFRRPRRHTVASNMPLFAFDVQWDELVECLFQHYGRLIVGERSILNVCLLSCIMHEMTHISSESSKRPISLSIRRNRLIEYDFRPNSFRRINRIISYIATAKATLTHCTITHNVRNEWQHRIAPQHRNPNAHAHRHQVKLKKWLIWDLLCIRSALDSDGILFSSLCSLHSFLSHARRDANIDGCSIQSSMGCLKTATSTFINAINIVVSSAEYATNGFLLTPETFINICACAVVPSHADRSQWLSHSVGNVFSSVIDDCRDLRLVFETRVLSFEFLWFRYFVCVWWFPKLREVIPNWNAFFDWSSILGRSIDIDGPKLVEPHASLAAVQSTRGRLLVTPLRFNDSWSLVEAQPKRVLFGRTNQSKK